MDRKSRMRSSVISCVPPKYAILSKQAGYFYGITAADQDGRLLRLPFPFPFILSLWQTRKDVVGVGYTAVIRGEMMLCLFCGGYDNDENVECCNLIHG